MDINIDSQVSQTIINGVTNKAPSENAVYGALALKLDSSTSRLIATRQFASLTNSGPTDSTTVYIGTIITSTPNATATNRQFRLPTGVIRSANIGLNVNTTLGTNETINVYLRNITDATSTSIGTITADAVANSTVVTGLAITTNSSKYYSIEYVFPTWATNPTNIQHSVEVDIFNA